MVFSALGWIHWLYPWGSSRPYRQELLIETAHSFLQIAAVSQQAQVKHIKTICFTSTFYVTAAIQLHLQFPSKSFPLYFEMFANK